DPCLNPDGRDRYVSWFHSVTGKNYNPSLDAREHREPWPGGRTNHYNFDLNRDWAWQTQVESQQRMKVYNQWLPHVHVDFHEQGVNSPYYFAPAAQPYHEVITKWQRDFQTTIGRNHARYFDERGWLYFTREVFDLLYPSYGDTYPTFNGAIGMTYEQAGGPAGGTAALTETGDTLTLLDRIMHHHTTGLSTVEVASNNASQLVNEFRNFYANAAKGAGGTYQSYVIKYNDRDEQRIQALMQLMDKNEVKYYSGKAGNYRGFNYNSGKEEGFSVGERDLVIPATQQRGTLVRVLFEPNTTVVDSVTYDITAWAMPYAYGINAYAAKTAIPTVSIISSLKGEGGEINISTVSSENAYGYVIPWKGLKSVQLVSRLLQKGIKLRMNEQPFEMGGRQFDRGSVIVLKTSNQYYPGLWSDVRSAALHYGVTLTPLTGGMVEKGADFGSSKVRPLKARRIALLTGEGVGSNAAGEVWHFFDQAIDYPVTLVNVNDFGRFRINDYDVLIMPDGNYRFLNDKASADMLRNWIQAGGNLVALESAVTQLSRQDWSIKSKKNEDGESKDTYAS
ncbi:MAG TPA: zinc carboxypeptidase, partial [Flavisolibacter sp.]|nr:zinc carboxypeptidase [Flavisolibacter sp.]